MHYLFAHAARRHCVAVRCRLEIGDDVLNRPSADALAWVCRDVGRVPALQQAALQIARVLVGAHDGLRRMTGAAMTERIDEVAPPIPLRGFGRVPRKSTGYEVDRIPHDHCGSDVERE